MESKYPKQELRCVSLLLLYLIYTYAYLQEIATGRRVLYMLVYFTKGFSSTFISTCFSELHCDYMPREIECLTCFTSTMC